ncbi:hypothetical protein LCGC14_2409780 [marine sediment metagenome]|uniref:Uncharacterized protein n=1 Tax=marine sediment metagenome TaxID=412755 RepID=A0A0F9CEZ2_9ZZZZ
MIITPQMMLDLLPRHLELVRSKPCAVSSRLSLGLLSLPLLTLPLNVAPYHLDQSVSHVNALKSTGSLESITQFSRQSQVNGAHGFGWGHNWGSSRGVALAIAALIRVLSRAIRTSVAITAWALHRASTIWSARMYQ